MKVTKMEELIGSLIAVAQLARDEEGQNKKTLDSLYFGLVELEQLNKGEQHWIAD